MVRDATSPVTLETDTMEAGDDPYRSVFDRCLTARQQNEEAEDERNHAEHGARSDTQWYVCALLLLLAVGKSGLRCDAFAGNASFSRSWTRGCFEKRLRNDS